jgi:hypothetical protein
MATKRKLPRGFYWIPVALTVLAVALTLAGDRIGILSNPSAVRVLYLLLALAVALFTFGLLGDSHAVISAQNPNGFAWQAGGSFAGVVILFGVLVWGLSPYRALTVHLLKPNGDFFGQREGNVEVVLAAESKRSVETNRGEAIFAYLPQAEPWQLRIAGGRWKIDKAEPDGCLQGAQVDHSSRCRVLTLTLAEVPLCLLDLTRVAGQAAPAKTTLRRLLEGFRDDMQEHGTAFAVPITYSPALRSGRVLEAAVTFQRAPHELKACDDLADIEQQVNYGSKSPVRLYASCSGVYAASAAEPAPADYTRCSR